MSSGICFRTRQKQLTYRTCFLSVLMIYLTFVKHVFGSLKSGNGVVKNKGIDVPIGRSVYLSSDKHLHINVGQGDRCKVMVVQNDLLSRSPGHLAPKEFSCAFPEKFVQYTHFGSKDLIEDRVHLMIRYDSNNQTSIIPIVFYVCVKLVQLEVLTKNIPLNVPGLLQTSDSISQNNTHFSYDRDNQYCRITLLSRTNGLPSYGYIASLLSDLSMIDCDLFLQSDIVYKHTASLSSPNKDIIPFVVEVLDKDGDLMKQEFFQKSVIIQGGLENTRPRPSFNALLYMDVSQGNAVSQFVTTAIPPSILSAEDYETPADQLIFNITGPVGPDQGVIVCTDDRHQPIQSFYQKDVKDLKIAYKPPASDSNVTRSFRIQMQIIDGDGLKSAPFILFISVKPMNTLSPKVTTNRGIQLFEGQSRLIHSSNLVISDEDNIAEVKIFLIDGVRHGRLNLPKGREYFTPNDIKNGRIIYDHDGSNTYSDNMIFRMTDGTHAVEFLFPVTIYPEDDEAPILNVNVGLQVKKHEVIEINRFILSATDIDSDDSKITFIVSTPYSLLGRFIKRQFQIPTDLIKWQFVDGVYQQIADHFTQQDIVDGKIFYQHIGPHISTVIFDEIHFKLVDNMEPPNQSKDYKFTVKIFPIDDQAPRLYTSTNLKMDVDEFQMTVIKRKDLRYTDEHTNDGDLRYTITHRPFDTDSYSRLHAGGVTLCESPSNQISFFTQSQVNHQKICYLPPNSELGLTKRIIRFIFEVEDRNGNVLKNQNFQITLNPVNNKAPIIRNRGFRVYENGRFILNRKALDIQDPDTDNSEIKISIIRTPELGILKRIQQPLSYNDVISFNDIVSGKIVYINSGEEGIEDEFTVDVTDSIHHVLVNIHITVIPMDDEAPVFIGNKSDILFIHAEVDERQETSLWNTKIRATDPDTDDMNLTFLIKKFPREGTLLLNNQRIDKFTQKDLINQNVYYRHRRGEIGPNEKNDSFSLILTDDSRNFELNDHNVKSVEVFMKIQPVNNLSPRIILGAPYGVAEGKKGPIVPRHLDSLDDDSNYNLLHCIIMQQPAYGYIENTSPATGSEKSRAGLPVSAFYVKDISNGKINYVQSVHKGIEKRKDEFRFKCTDGINFSRIRTFRISIYPENDEEPEVYIREFIVMEGMELKIDSPILKAVDKDKPSSSLTFIITRLPKHGQILQQRHFAGTFPVLSFKMSDIERSSTIMYKHDDSETLHDSFDFVLTDGKFNITQTVPIVILPIDDETPRLSINVGLEMDVVRTRKHITNQVLRAEDVDSADSNITFKLRKCPRHGFILKRYNNWEVNLTLGMNFTQNDIDNRNIIYVHTGVNGGRDLIKFDVTDGLNPLIDQYFYISIAELDTIYPQVINKGIQLPEGGGVVLTTLMIGATDINSPDENLNYTVTDAPYHGFLESLDSPGIPILTFSQLQLAGSKIRYVHNSDSEVKMDRFEFEVTDGNNPVTRTFRIAITDVDNKKPVLLCNKLRIMEGGNKIISPFELRIEDMDTSNDKLIIYVTQVPLHGNILFNFSQTVHTFTYDDILANRISYQHDGTETTHDGFSFTVTDGTHNYFYVLSENTLPTKVPQTLHIEIVAVDNGVPQISTNKGITSLNALQNGEIGTLLTKKVLRAEDRDSPDETLTFFLTTPPKHGYIFNTGSGNETINTWTQADINALKIRYILKSGSNATSDTFFFKLRDEGGNVLANQPFHLTWCFVSFSSSEYTVKENELLEIALQRRGFLQETVFVTIKATNGTARVGEDTYPWYSPQIQFNPGQTEKSWKLHIKDDDKFERSESFRLELVNAISAVVEPASITEVTIVDPEDESVVEFTWDKESLAENIGEILVPIRRTGDLSTELMVICATESGTATGSPAGRVLSGSDFFTRPFDHRSIIRFDAGESERFCRVTIIDDSLYEPEEEFRVLLTEVMGGRTGSGNETSVYIQPDVYDEPVFSFSHPQYSVDESDKFVQVVVRRTGTDLTNPSSVSIRSRMTNPKSAQAGLDYIAVNKILDFAPGVTMNTISVKILDDLGRPHLEGVKSFQIILKAAMGGALGSPHKALIHINDTVSDLPSMSFKDESYVVDEERGYLDAVIVRHGDIRHESSVRCYTRQASAKVMMDYVERPDTDVSTVTFLPGEREKVCRVGIVNDNQYEPENESFRLHLGSPKSSTAGYAILGSFNNTIILINDETDKPVIHFGQRRFYVNEPLLPGDMTVMSIPVVRKGDASGVSRVQFYTKDGSAKSGEDYNPLAKTLVFHKNVMKVLVEIAILYDGVREISEVFTVHINPDINMVAEVKRNERAQVYIEEKKKLADVAFPLLPLVVSLRDYDHARIVDRKPISGYPVICITACNPKHPNYTDTASVCLSQKINDSITRFRWKVADPTFENGVTVPLQDIQSAAFFASTTGITLDSVYFRGGSRVQCIARAFNMDGEPGKEVSSVPVLVDAHNGLCMPRMSGVIGNEPYSTRIRYTGPDDKKHPNKVHVSVILNHVDGLLPVVSTYKPSNFDYILTKSSLRVAQHQCSNLLDVTEGTGGFITNSTHHPNAAYEVEDYQYSTDLRSAQTVRFYRNLNLEACIWEIDGYFGMSELVSKCGARIRTSGQVLDSHMSALTLDLWLYVSYVFYSPQVPSGWLHIDQQSELPLTFVYNTGLLWQNGISSQMESPFQGSLYPSGMTVLKDGRLQVTFKTKANFNGKFILQSNSGSQVVQKSHISLINDTSLTFFLRLIRSDSSFNQPVQQWQFESSIAVKDYSGVYLIHLIPCTVPIYQSYTTDNVCNPGEIIRFSLPIRFQQISDPVPAKFTLNTNFQLYRKREDWLSPPSNRLGRDSSFTPGEKIYGRIDVDNSQHLGENYIVLLEKVFLCAGKDGYIPKYDPAKGEYGCLTKDSNLLHHFKVIDRLAPDTVDLDLDGIPISAVLAADDIHALATLRLSGADGFVIDASPLFQSDAGRMWFLHVLYNVRSTGQKKKREVSYHLLSQEVMTEERQKRSLEDTTDIGVSGKGTNMVRIVLTDKHDDEDADVSESTQNQHGQESYLIPTLIGIAVLLLIMAVVMVVIIKRKKKHSSPPPSPSNTITVVSGNGRMAVVQINTQGDLTEV